MSLTKFSELFSKQFDCISEVEDGALLVDFDSYKIKVTIEENWLISINHFFRARQYEFNNEERMLSANRFVEFQIVRLDRNIFSSPDYSFSDDKENIVTISYASEEFILNFFNSDSFTDIGSNIIKERIRRKLKRKPSLALKSERARSLSLPIGDFFIKHVTAKYTPKTSINKEKLCKIGKEKIQACLFNLSYAKNECFELRGAMNSKSFRIVGIEAEDEKLTIPHAKYKDDLVTFYKVAKSSLFPGQAYLSYYHILEYNFLRVADEMLFSSVKGELNKPNYQVTYSNVNKLLAVIKRNDNLKNETDMLKSVLKKYVSEDELIALVQQLEDKTDEKRFSNPKNIIFGQPMGIKLESGHVLGTTANIIKHIRNALVHSSDHYSREDCFLHFSEAESVVLQFLPIIKFLSESIIFSTAD